MALAASPRATAGTGLSPPTVDPPVAPVYLPPERLPSAPESSPAFAPTPPAQLTPFPPAAYEPGARAS
jgi:hypothetical protein